VLPTAEVRVNEKPVPTLAKLTPTAYMGVLNAIVKDCAQKHWLWRACPLKNGQRPALSTTAYEEMFAVKSAKKVLGPILGAIAEKGVLCKRRNWEALKS